MMKCPHCGWEYPIECNIGGLVPPHSFQEGKKFQDGGPPCPGNGQYPRNAQSDMRPLWKDGGVP